MINYKREKIQQKKKKIIHCVQTHAISMDHS